MSADLFGALAETPEPSGLEQRTAATVADWLGDRGLSVQRGIAGHGVLVRLGAGPCTLLRAELDAVHAADSLGHHCGHDGHMAMLCQAVVEMADSDAPPSIAALFQPAEETGTGMAACLQDPRVADLPVRSCLAIHNVPGHPLGQVLLGPGALASQGLRIRLRGRSSHAAHPAEGVSPWSTMRSAADAILAHRDGDPRATLVHVRLGDEAYGTSPGSGVVAATLRGSITEQVEDLARRLQPDPEHVAVECDTVEPFPATRNDPALLREVARVARAADLRVTELAAPWPWSEDFGHATARWPGALIGLGAGVDHAPLHDASYRFPRDLLPYGVRLWRSIGGIA